MLHYLVGDATTPVGSGIKIIAHICNDQGGWGKGFVLSISSRWKEPEQDYREWFRQPDFNLGKTRFIQVSSDIIVANMVAQKGYRSLTGSIPLQYDALRQCLVTVFNQASRLNSTVHMPLIGTGLAGGDWNLIENIIIDEMKNTDTFIYRLQ